MKKEQAYAYLKGDKYYSPEDLRYNVKHGFMLSKDDYEDFLTTKDELLTKDDELFCKLPLVTFNSPYCFYTNGQYLLNKLQTYVTTILDDYYQNDEILIDRNFSDIILSRAFSEIEGTLRIENVPTTRKRIQEIFRSDSLRDKNDIIIKNMINAMNFIMKGKPEFNKENLNKLYTILSNECLDEENRLLSNAFYRHDEVFIGGFSGAPVDKINEMMDSLFSFVNNAENLRKYDMLIPHICHYYILYVHPYFDYNGRTARMVSFWLSYILDIPAPPYFISEAINENKRDYYKAITNTRITKNDLTYFLGYIMESSIKFCYLYKNLEEIKKTLFKSGDTLSQTEMTYIKKILIHNPDDIFNYKMFLEYINGTVSKQGAFKILDKMVQCKLLIKSKNKKGSSIYKINQEFITYKYE